MSWAVLLALALLDMSISHSHYQSGLLSISFHCCQPPYLSLESLLVLLFPSSSLCIAGQNLLVRGLSGSFLSSPTLPSVSLRIVWDSLRLLSFPSVSWGLVHLSQLPGPAFCIVGLVCTCLDSLTHPLHHGMCVFFQSLGPTLCATRFVCVLRGLWPPHLSWHPRLALCAVGLLWLLSVPQA